MLDTILTFILYTGIILFVPVLSGKIMRYNGKNKRVWLLLLCLTCALIASLRGISGTDSEMYISAYKNGTNTITRWSDFEVGFVMLCNFMGNMGLPYQFMFFFMAFIPICCVFKAIEIEKENINVELATFIYVSDLYFWGFNGMRQGFALGICLLAMVMYFNGQKIKPILLLCISVLFHKSACVCLIVIVAREIFYSRYRRFFLVLSVIITAYLVYNRTILGTITGWITGSGYYASYFTREAYVDTSPLKYYLKISPILILCFSMLRKLLSNKRMFAYFVLMLIGIIVSSLGSITATQISRLGLYFSMLEIFVCGYMGSQKSVFILNGAVKGKTFNRIVLYGYFGFMFYYETFYRGFSALVPYGLPY